MLDWLWIIVFLSAILVEVVTLGQLVSIWFAVGAAGALLVQWMGGEFVLQMFTFIGVSVLAMLAVRPLAAAYLRGNVVSTNVDRFIGQQVHLIKGISEGSWGEIKFNGLIYAAISVDNRAIETGELVEIVAIEGAKLIVRKIDSIER